MKTRLHYFLGLLFAVGLLFGSFAPARALDLSFNIGIAPPPLPVCVQPACPGLGYIWTPGYWAWDPGLDQYYWVPGTWVLAPEIGLLWTPAWWGCDNGIYSFHPGYWGRTVGFYGGINYGYGYFGRGYDGGYWRGNHFYYNRAANNVRALAASRTYERAVAERNNSRVSFNGPGGTTARETAAERRAASANRIAATSAQQAQVRAARSDPAMRFSSNHGTPAVTGTTRPGELRANAAAATPNTTTAQQRRNVTAANERRATEHASRSASEGAFTGESRAASVPRTGSHMANTGQRLTHSASAENSFTGERSVSHTAPASERVARSNAIEHERQSNFAEERRVSSERAAAPSRTFESHAAMSRPSFHEAAPRSFSAPSRAPAMHAAAPARGGGGAVHASAGPAQRGR